MNSEYNYMMNDKDRLRYNRGSMQLVNFRIAVSHKLPI
jgi:hypothetical protein